MTKRKSSINDPVEYCGWVDTPEATEHDLERVMHRENVAVEALQEIANYATILTPVQIAMDVLDKLGVRHRGTPAVSPQDEIGRPVRQATAGPIPADGPCAGCGQVVMMPHLCPGL